MIRLAAIAGATLAAMAIGPGFATESAPKTFQLQARIVAVGLPGVAGVRQVGRFHSGGPIPGNPEFLMSTAAGRVLDPERVMVAVGSNFGAPLGNTSHAAGSVLSIDPRGGPAGATLIVPKTFAETSGGRSAAGGAIQLYTAQSAAFQNRYYNGRVRTADFAAASGPRYLSINNAFGRPWIANAPLGLSGAGSVTVVDPDGRPLDNAPSETAGGVFAGRATDREWSPKAQPSNWIAKALNYRASRQLTPGSLTHGALGTAFLGASPDGSGFAVFAVIAGDGSVVQAHVQDGIDGLAPPDTIGRLGTDDSAVIGVAFKWNPDRVLYVADPARDRLVLLHLDHDRRHFRVSRTAEIALAELKQPVDIAAALPEIANPGFASHTTLAGGSDLYVANRGDGSLLRVSQDGRVLARAEIEVPGLGLLARDRIRAIAVSADAQRLWLTLQGELPEYKGHEGVLIEVSAFDANGAFSGEQPRARPGISAAGERAFTKEHVLNPAMGPLFNARSCVECHPGPGGMSSREEHFVRRVARMDTVTGRVASVDHPNSPVSRRHSIREDGDREAPAAELPRQANVVSLRMPLALYASALLDEIPDIEIAAQAVSKGDGIKGRVHYVTSVNGEQRVGRYGWKAHVATLEEMVAEAFASEIGIASSLVPHSPANRQPSFKDNDDTVRSIAAYLRELRLPGKESRP